MPNGLTRLAPRVAGENRPLACRAFGLRPHRGVALLHPGLPVSRARGDRATPAVSALVCLLAQTIPALHPPACPNPPACLLIAGKPGVNHTHTRLWKHILRMAPKSARVKDRKTFRNRRGRGDGMVAALPRRHRNVPRVWCKSPRYGEDGNLWIQ